MDIINIASGKLQPADGRGYSENIGVNPNNVAHTADPYEELKKLGQLKEQGIITEEEFAKMKADCLKKIR